jgi:hypothetical protein
LLKVNEIDFPNSFVDFYQESMVDSESEKFEIAIAELVFISSMSFADAIGRLCENNQDRQASSLLLASISHATHSDHYLSLDVPNTLQASIHRYRVIAALSADVALLSRKPPYQWRN